jgi:hypothetical protein
MSVKHLIFDDFVEYIAFKESERSECTLEEARTCVCNYIEEQLDAVESMVGTSKVVLSEIGFHRNSISGMCNAIRNVNIFNALLYQVLMGNITVDKFCEIYRMGNINCNDSRANKPSMIFAVTSALFIRLIEHYLIEIYQFQIPEIPTGIDIKDCGVALPGLNDSNLCWALSGMHAYSSVNIVRGDQRHIVVLFKMMTSSYHNVFERDIPGGKPYNEYLYNTMFTIDLFSYLTVYISYYVTGVIVKLCSYIRQTYIDEFNNTTRYCSCSIFTIRNDIDDEPATIDNTYGFINISNHWITCRPKLEHTDIPFDSLPLHLRP